MIYSEWKKSYSDDVKAASGSAYLKNITITGKFNAGFLCHSPLIFPFLVMHALGALFCIR
ncbi:MAG: hypothetical protein E7K90_13860 [Hafnia alvei]|uniref:hypothetical protein n=1 Tax=Hafnia alvei TaxID=569 RepID=UPI002911561B|nr:hypothetical protein [Hafnia alvei]MDU7482464.1 hypothetical protein [Hafnia alvei]